MADARKQINLQVVSAFIPSDVKQVIEKMAEDEDRSTSKVVRRLIEESPRIRSALRNGKTKAA